jgi:glutathione S-transferase
VTSPEREGPSGTIPTLEPGDHTAIFDRVIATSVVDCFSARNVSLRSTEPSSQSAEPYKDGAVLAFIGLFGQTLTGTLLVAVRRELAEVVARADQRGVSAQTAYVDFMAELTNELLGRIKNLLVSYGVHFQLGLPKALACAEFWLHTIPGDTHRAQRFASQHYGDVCAWFDVVLAPDFVIIPPGKGAVVPCLKEGELLML